jgi:hypothetical protein
VHGATRAPFSEALRGLTTVSKKTKKEKNPPNQEKERKKKASPLEY